MPHNLKFQGPQRLPPDPDLYPFYIGNAQGLWLHWKSWFPTTGTLRGVILALHGLAEHAGRYDGTFAFFNNQGFAVFMMEHQGHGGSEGERKYVERFQDFVDDQLQFLNQVVLADSRVVGLPKFLFGHSMGGLIAAHVALATPDTWTGVVLSGPALRADPNTATPFLRAVATKLSSWAPKTGVSDLDPSLVCRNQAVVQFYQQDPLVPTNKLPARFGAEFLIAMDALFSKAAGFRLPVLICHGEADKLCTLDGSKEFIQQISSADKELIVYPGLFHEILNEEKSARDKVRADMLGFLDRRLAATAPTS